jgi:Domain of unknown function (DUF4279)
LISDPKIRECSFEIAARDLDPARVSALFCVEPDRAFRRGDQSVGKARHFQGVWAISSSSRVKLPDPREHLEFIVNFAIEHKNEIQELRKTIDVKVGIRLLWEFEDATLVFGLKHEKFSNLVNVIDWIGFSVT